MTNLNEEAVIKVLKLHILLSEFKIGRGIKEIEKINKRKAEFFKKLVDSVGFSRACNLLTKAKIEAGSDPASF